MNTSSRHCMVLSCQLIRQGKESQVPIGYEAEWVRKIPYRCQESNHVCPAPSLLTIPTQRCQML